MRVMTTKSKALPDCLIKEDQTILPLDGTIPTTTSHE
jgi:hypothetical protein